jgi:hypothetical protein
MNTQDIDAHTLVSGITAVVCFFAAGAFSPHSGLVISYGAVWYVWTLFLAYMGSGWPWRGIAFHMMAEALIYRKEAIRVQTELDNKTPDL